MKRKHTLFGLLAVLFLTGCRTNAPSSFAKSGTNPNLEPTIYVVADSNFAEFFGDSTPEATLALEALERESFPGHRIVVEVKSKRDEDMR